MFPARPSCYTVPSKEADMWILWGALVCLFLMAGLASLVVRYAEPLVDRLLKLSAVRRFFERPSVTRFVERHF